MYFWVIFVPTSQTKVQLTNGKKAIPANADEAGSMENSFRTPLNNPFESLKNNGLCPFNKFLTSF